MAIINSRPAYHSYPASLDFSSDRLLDTWLPQFLFYLILSTIPFFKFRQLGDLFFLKVDWLLTAALLAIVFLILIITKDLPSRLRSNIWLPMLLFYVVNVFASLLSPYPDLALGGIVTLTQVIIFAMINLIMLNHRGIETYLPWVIGTSIAINAALGLIGANLGVDDFIEGGRALGGTIGANNMALMSVFAFPIMIFQFLYAKTASLRILAGMATILILAGLIASESRGGFLNFLVVLALLTWHFRRHLNVRYLGVVFAGTALAITLFLVSVPADYWERQATLGLLTEAATGSRAELTEDSSLDRRAAYLSVALDAIVNNPIIGSGTDTFREIWFLSTESDAFDNTRRPAHNTYVEVLVGSGVIGFFAFLALLLVTYRNYSSAEALFIDANDTRAADLVATYRIAYLAVLFYFLVKSGLDHKLFILSVPLSSILLAYAREKTNAGASENFGPE